MDSVYSQKLSKLEGINHAVSQTKHGNMDFRFGDKQEVLANRRRFLNENNLSLDQCMAIRVEQGDQIKFVGEDDQGSGMFELASAKNCDCLITDQPKIGLFLPIGDCIPAIIYDPKNHAVALMHLGWQGTDKKLAPKVTRRMQTEFKSKPQDLIAYLGPGIKPASYSFKKPIQQTGDPDWQPYLQDNGKTVNIDIFGYNVAQLEQVGAPTENIEVSPVDTYQDQRFFSHRRSQTGNQTESRFAMVVMLK